ncbi:MAG: hypothetical protein SVG88_10245 [Halobacteriales archaeon]|nr:hypothetical protein [Halobacteriales archaeon]
MEVRDAVEADAEALGQLVDTPTDVLRNLIHDRTVRVVEVDDSPSAFVSYDARPETVYITQLDGDPATYERLLEEPIRFARREQMTVELLVGEDDDPLRSAATNAGFDEIGGGPRFENEPTIRYRFTPE